MWEFAYFAQDQWTIKRLTVNYGLRLDTVHTRIPANNRPASRFVGAQSFSELDCIPCWKDLSPRLAAAYDLFGNGKTALKASLSRYVGAQTMQLAEIADPVTAAVNSVTRAWSDTNGSFVPDCDLQNPLANGECAQISNLAFGQPRITTRVDPEVVNGWNNRNYDWQASATVEHELRPGIAVNAGYFRTWYGNFTAVDNLAVTPADYDPYCITLPANAGIADAGQQICGLYNIKPAKFGLVDNLITFASHYGKQRNVFNGFDFGINARLPRGGVLAGGLSVGNAVAYGSNDGTSHSIRCFAINSPEETRLCDAPVPYLAQFKLFGTYLLPGDVQVSANFQSVPGAPVNSSVYWSGGSLALGTPPTNAAGFTVNETAVYNATAAEIAASLGRAPSGGVRTVAIPVGLPWTLFEDRINQLDIRALRGFRIKRARVEGTVDVFNVFNTAAVLNETTVIGAAFRRPTQILQGRMVKFGAKLNF
jgi:hypothetical protein